MLTKFKEGLLWGLGFSLSVIFVFYGFNLAEEWITKPEHYIEPSPIKDKPYEILSKTYRIVPSSDEFRGGLVISGKVQFGSYKLYEKLEIAAYVTDKDGVYVDTCGDYRLRESPVATEFYFKVMCEHITSKEQFETFEFELLGREI